MLSNKTCMFIGEKTIKNYKIYGSKQDFLCQLEERLRQILLSTIFNGYNYFVCGLDLGYDMIFAESIIKLKKKYPEIIFEVAIPYETYTINWNQNDKERFFNIVAKCDKESLLNRRFTSDCRLQRNKYMIEKSDFIITIFDDKYLNNYPILGYARKLKRQVLHMNPSTFKTTYI